MTDFSELRKGDEERWISILEENIQDREEYLATDIRWSYQKRQKMAQQLKTYKKALRILNEE